MSERFGNVPGVRPTERRISAHDAPHPRSRPQPWHRAALAFQARAAQPRDRSPWLQNSVHILPIEDAPFHILPIALDGETQFVTEPVSTSPMTLIDALRNR